MSQRTTPHIIASLLASIIVLSLFTRCDQAYSEQVRNPYRADLVRGINLEGPRDPFESHEIGPIDSLGFNWVALVPYAFSIPGETFVRWQAEKKYYYWGESLTGVAHCIEMAHAKGMKVMVKPHLWVKNQGWPGDFDLQTPEAWAAWEKDYREYVLAFATLADSLSAELFCIGTEVRHSVRQRPQFWQSLVRDVRAVYGGKLTYASNWDNYHNVTFWQDLDYIGVDGYFPLSEKAKPSKEELMRGWKPIKQELAKLSKSHDRPLLFTEYGYRSMIYSAGEHWNMNESELTTDMWAQRTAYDAFYETFNSEPWYAGGFLWKWSVPHDRSGGVNNSRFTPQNKPAQDIIYRWNKGLPVDSD
ncbi:MAG: hypothetical protein AAF944_15805 [Bacteroidota bacterium]